MKLRAISLFFSGKWAFNGDSRWSINAGSPTKKPQNRVLHSVNVYEVCPKRYFEISWKISGRNLNIISPFLWYIADNVQEPRKRTQQVRPGTLVKHNNQFAIIWQASQPVSWDAGIPGGHFPSNHALRAAWRMNQTRKRTAGNTLFMRIASMAHMINIWLTYDYALYNLSCIARRLLVKALASAAFVVRV